MTRDELIKTVRDLDEIEKVLPKATEGILAEALAEKRAALNARLDALLAAASAAKTPKKAPSARGFTAAVRALPSGQPLRTLTNYSKLDPEAVSSAIRRLVKQGVVRLAGSDGYVRV